MSNATAPEPHWLSEEQQRSWRAFQELSTGMASAIDRQLSRDSGLSGSEYAVLVTLSESETGVVRSRELLASLGWERSRLSHLLSRMEKRGLVSRARCDTDARGLDVTITEAGMTAITVAAPAHSAMVREAMIDLLTPEELAMLVSVRDKVVSSLTRMELL